MSITTDLFRALASRGQRLTRTRRAVVEALAAAREPVSVRALHDAVGAQTADLVTIYRTLRWLQDAGVARAVVTGPGAERYELIAPGGHAHHLRCDRCGGVRTITVCGVEREAMERIEREYRFTVHHHTLTFHGRCAECAAMEATPVSFSEGLRSSSLR